MMEKSRFMEDNPEQINIPIELAEKIDKVSGTGMSIYTSRADFIKGAVEIKLVQLKSAGSQ